MKIENAVIIFLFIINPSALALSSDAKMPYRFQSDSLIYNKTLHQMIYVGHVYVVQGSTTLSGDKLVISYGKSGQIKKMIVTGNLANYSTLPDHQRERLYAEAKTITFNPITKIVLLENQAKITQEKNIFTGSRIWYDIGAGIVRTTPDKNQGTVIVIQPQE